MARNRKRAKERRARRPQPVPSRRSDREEAPDPLEHATPDVELAEAQLRMGRPDLDASAIPGVTGYEPEVLPADEAAGFAEVPEEEPDDDAEPQPVGGGGGRDGARIRAGFDGDAAGSGDGGAGAAALPRPGAAVEHRPSLLARLIGFLQGSWRELQRVQWPDRRQVAQATSVVIGFVIVAAVFLGLSDLAFSHLVNYILYGKP